MGCGSRASRPKRKSLNHVIAPYPVSRIYDNSNLRITLAPQPGPGRAEKGRMPTSRADPLGFYDTPSELNSLHDNAQKSVCIIGSGAAGLITAKTLLDDGFTNLVVLTRDSSPGGVWEHRKVYSGVYINNLYGDYRFSSLPHPSHKEDEQISAEDMQFYMSKFAETFLKDRICYSTEILNIARPSPPFEYGEATKNWRITVRDLKEGVIRVLGFDRIVLCSGGCYEPRIPPHLSQSEIVSSGFKGPVVHSSEFRSRMEEILTAARPQPNAFSPPNSPGPLTSPGFSNGYTSLSLHGNGKVGQPPPLPGNGRIVVIGGGKSAQDIAAYLANEGRVENVVMVYEKTDAFIASNTRLSDRVRQSRLLGILSPHRELNTPLEKFLHKTWLGGKIVKSTFERWQKKSYEAFDIPETSPLRLTQPIFWSLRVNDEVCRRRSSFHSLVNEGKIRIIAPARVIGFAPSADSPNEGSDSTICADEHQWPQPHGVEIQYTDNGEIATIECSGIILATGYQSSWNKIFTKSAYNALGLGIYPPQHYNDSHFASEWNYTSLANPPVQHPKNREWSTHIYRGIVPCRNILRRDFAINGAVFSTNNAYVFETTAHWISSYFLCDPFLKIPSSPRAAIAETERASAWLRRRYPDMLHWTNESHCSEIAFWSWPQYVDNLLDDMALPSGRKRTGGSWVTWPFKPIDIMCISNLGQERRVKRHTPS